MPLILEIVTPDSKVYSAEVEYVLMPGIEGELGILPGHLPILTNIHPGEIELIRSGHKERLAVDKGFVRVYADTVSVLTEAAINVEEIDVGVVEEAQARAEKALEEAKQRKDIDPSQIEHLEAIARFSIVQKIAKQRKF